jgi:CheY-like chemotaxis protein
VARARNERERTSRGPPARRARSALLVDDLFDSRDMYGEILRFGGYEVFEASNGVDAL